MTKILDGKKLSLEIFEKISNEIKYLKKKGKHIPHLVIILIGDNHSSYLYVKNKIQDCKNVGINSSLLHFNNKISQKELIKEIYILNNDDYVDSFIIQFPLPDHIDQNKIILAINPKKDVDGIHPLNLGRLLLEIPIFIPATPLGIINLLKYYKINTKGKNVLIIGRSNIVGKPISILMSLKKWGNSTVTLVHSDTKNILIQSKKSDIIITAMGVPRFLTSDMIKKNVILIDVGINFIKDNKYKDYKIVGDIDFDNVYSKASYITPVPGGVGPMTRASLLMNTLISIKKNKF